MANPFNFTDVLTAPLSGSITSDQILVGGLVGSTNATIDVGTIVLNTVDTGLQSTTVTNGDQVAIKLTAPAVKATTIYSTLTIGDETDTFSVTTELEIQEIVDPELEQYDPFGIPYTPNPTNNKITIIDATTGLVDQIIPLLAPVSPLPEDPTNNVYISNYWSNSVFVFNPTTKLVAKEVAVGSYPTGLSYIVGGSIDPQVWVVSSGTDQILRLDPTTHEVAATVLVGGGPYGIESYGLNSLFITRLADNKVSHLTSTGIDTFSAVEIPGFDQPLEVTEGFGSMWVANSGSNTVSRVDPLTNTIIATVVVGAKPWGIAANNTHVWVANSSDFTISKIDPVSNLVVATISVGFIPYKIEADDNNDIWVALYGENKVIQIDPITGIVTDTITVDPTAYDVMLLDGKMWVMNYWADTPSRVTATDQSPDSLYFIPQPVSDQNVLVTSNSIVVTGINRPTPASIEPGIFSAVLYKNGISVGTSTTVEEFDTLYITLQSSANYSKLREVTLTIGDQQAPFSVTTADAVQDPNPFSFAPVTGALPSTEYTSNTVTISGLSVGISTTVTVSAGSIVKNTIDVGPGPTTAENGDTFAIKLVSSNQFCKTISSTLTVGNVSGSYLITVAAASSEYVQPIYQATDPYWNGVGYAVNLAAPRQITRVNPTTGTVTSQFTVTNTTDLIAAAAQKDFPYIANYYHDSISQIDPDTLATVRNIALDPGDAPYGLTYTPTVALAQIQTKLWASLTGTNEVISFDPSTMAIVDRIAVGNRPMGLAATSDGSIFVANRESNTVTKINLSLLTFDTAVGSLPFELAVDNNDLVWVTNSGSDTVTVINGITNAVVDTITVGNNPWDITYAAGHMWVSNSYDNTVTAVDATTRIVVATIAVGSVPFNIVADQNDQIWVTHFGEDKIFRISPTSMAITHEVTVGSVHYGASFSTTDGHLWVTNYYTDTPIRTALVDLVPDAITFNPIEAGLSEIVISNTQTIVGIDRDLEISVPTVYSASIIHNGVNVGQSVNVSSGDTVAVQMTAATGFDTIQTLSLSFCGSIIDWVVTTIPDTIPNPFGFGSVDNAIVRDPIYSDTTPIVGMSDGAFGIGILIEPSGLPGIVWENRQLSGNIRINGLESAEPFPVDYLTVDQTYYIVRESPLKFRLALTSQDAIDNIVIVTSGGVGSAGIDQGTNDPIPFVIWDTTTFQTSIEHGLQTGDSIIVTDVLAARIYNNDSVAIQVYPAGPFGATRIYNLDISGVQGGFQVKTIDLLGAIEYDQRDNPHSSQSAGFVRNENTIPIANHLTAIRRNPTQSVLNGSGFIKDEIIRRQVVGGPTAIRHERTSHESEAPRQGVVQRIGTPIENESPRLSLYFPRRTRQHLFTIQWAPSGLRKIQILMKEGPPAPIRQGPNPQNSMAQYQIVKRDGYVFHLDSKPYVHQQKNLGAFVNQYHIKAPSPDPKIVDVSHIISPAKTTGEFSSTQLSPPSTFRKFTQGYSQTKQPTATYLKDGYVVVPKKQSTTLANLAVAVRNETPMLITISATAVVNVQTFTTIAGMVAINGQPKNFYIPIQPIYTASRQIVVVDEYNIPQTCADQGLYDSEVAALAACQAEGHTAGSCNAGVWPNSTCWFWTYDIVDTTFCENPGVGAVEDLDIVAGYIRGG